MPDRKKQLVIFVCTGNTCRSPLAEGAFRKILPEKWRERVDVISAGVAAAPDAAVSRNSVAVAARNSIDLSQKRSIPLTSELGERADLLIALEAFHIPAIQSVLGGEATKIVLLRDLLPPDDPMAGLDISDPFGGSMEEYEDTFRQIWSAIEKGWPQIERRLSDGSLS